MSCSTSIAPWIEGICSSVTPKKVAHRKDTFLEVFTVLKLSKSVQKRWRTVHSKSSKNGMPSTSRLSSSVSSNVNPKKNFDGKNFESRTFQKVQDEGNPSSDGGARRCQTLSLYWGGGPPHLKSAVFSKIDTNFVLGVT